MSPATNARYPTGHAWFKGNGVGNGQGKPRKIVEPVAKWAERRNHCLEVGDGKPPPPLPTRLELWTFFILGNVIGGNNGIIVYYAYSQQLRKALQRAKLQFLVPELHISYRQPTDEQFWNVSLS